MSAVRTTVVLDEEPIEIRAYSGNLPGRPVIASIEVDGLTILSSLPGALRRLARALAEAEDKADALRATIPAVVPA